MGIVKEIAGAAIPYVALGVAGYLAYHFIANSTVGKTLEKLPEKAAEKAEEIQSRTPVDWLKRTPAGKAFNGDWAGAAIGLTGPGMIWNLLN